MQEIRAIIEEYERIDFTRERAALASVVNVEQSSYRRIGARMLVRGDGRWTGGISGGCLERDALQRAQMAIFSNTPTRVVYDTTEEDEYQIGVGLGCNGRVEVLFTPLDAADENNEVLCLRDMIATERPVILLKVIDAPDGTGLLGRHRLVSDLSAPRPFAGLATDTLRELIAATLDRRRPRVYDLAVDGRPLRLLVEYIRPETRLIVVGDNYDVAALLGIARELGWECHVVGKARKLTRAAFELARSVVDYDQAHTLPLHDHTAVVLMSHDYDKDKALLPYFLRQPLPYLGVLGPKKRLLKLQEDLGLDLENRPRLYAPTGLEIGAETPHEIALAVTAEIVAVMRGKQGGHLRAKAGSIYARE